IAFSREGGCGRCRERGSHAILWMPPVLRQRGPWDIVLADIPSPAIFSTRRLNPAMSTRKSASKSPAKTGMRRGLTAYGDEDFSLFLRKAFIKAMGYSDAALDRPIIGITNTYSGFNACHRNVPELIEAVKRGVMLAGGMPVDFPTISLHESFAWPTSMYLRNLMSVDTEEMIRGLPVDAVVLIGGCDKTVPALLMGAASANVPSILMVTGPMITGDHHGERLGACTDCRRFWARFRANDISEREIG